MKDAVFFNKVYVIQALKKGEFQTGRRLYVEIIKPGSLSDTDLHTEFFESETAKEFIKILDLIREDAARFDFGPLLHIEAHGNPDGLVMPTGEMVEWETIVPVLVSINRHCRFNLLLILAACRAGYFIKKLIPPNPAPVWSLIAPSQDISPQALFNAFSEFYKNFLPNLDGREALHEMWKHVDGGSRKIGYFSSQLLFKIAFDSYEKTYNSEFAAKSRVNDLMCQILEENPAMKPQKDKVIRDLLSMIHDNRAHFDRSKASFFMAEEFPEVYQRMELTYEEFLLERDNYTE